jgi:hypothetical protein
MWVGSFCGQKDGRIQWCQKKFGTIEGLGFGHEEDAGFTINGNVFLCSRIFSVVDVRNI